MTRTKITTTQQGMVSATGIEASPAAEPYATPAPPVCYLSGWYFTGISDIDETYRAKFQDELGCKQLIFMGGAAETATNGTLFQKAADEANLPQFRVWAGAQAIGTRVFNGMTWDEEEGETAEERNPHYNNCTINHDAAIQWCLEQGVVPNAEVPTRIAWDPEGWFDEALGRGIMGDADALHSRSRDRLIAAFQALAEFFGSGISQTYWGHVSLMNGTSIINDIGWTVNGSNVPTTTFDMLNVSYAFDQYRNIESCSPPKLEQRIQAAVDRFKELMFHYDFFLPSLYVAHPRYADIHPDTREHEIGTSGTQVVEFAAGPVTPGKPYWYIYNVDTSANGIIYSGVPATGHTVVWTDWPYPTTSIGEVYGDIDTYAWDLRADAWEAAGLAKLEACRRIALWCNENGRQEDIEIMPSFSIWYSPLSYWAGTNEEWQMIGVQRMIQTMIDAGAQVRSYNLWTALQGGVPFPSGVQTSYELLRSGIAGHTHTATYAPENSAGDKQRELRLAYTRTFYDGVDPAIAFGSSSWWESANSAGVVPVGNPNQLGLKDVAAKVNDRIEQIITGVRKYPIVSDSNLRVLQHSAADTHKKWNLTTWVPTFSYDVVPNGWVQP